MNFRCDFASDLFGGNKKQGINRKLYEGDYGVRREDIVVKSNFEGISKGRYVTVTRKNYFSQNAEERRYFIRSLARAITSVIKSHIKNRRGVVLVAGLGNGYMTSDALGKMASEKIIVTRGSGLSDSNEICAFSVGVSGVTGIESYEVVKGLVSQINPILLICIDALCAFNEERIGKVYQITDTGIVAGSGTERPSSVKLNKEELKIPVLAIGVPLVVSAKRIIAEACGENEIKIDEIYNDMYVTPRNIDAVVEECAEIVSSALNLSLIGKG